MCHVGLWAERIDALAKGDVVEATKLATRIAATRSSCAKDVNVKAQLLAEIEDARRLPATMIVSMLMLGIERETQLIVDGILPLVD